MPRPISAAALLAGGLAFAGVEPAFARQTQTFPDVSVAVFECVKVLSESENGTVYEPRAGDAGTATTRSTVWSVVMAYERNAATGDLQYTMVHKTWIVPAGAVWSGIEDTLRRCR